MASGTFAGTVTAGAVVSSGNFDAARANFTGAVNVGAGDFQGTEVSANALIFRNPDSVEIATLGWTGMAVTLHAPEGLLRLQADGDLYLEPGGTLRYNGVTGVGTGGAAGSIPVRINGAMRNIDFY